VLFVSRNNKVVEDVKDKWVRSGLGRKWIFEMLWYLDTSRIDALGEEPIQLLTLVIYGTSVPCLAQVQFFHTPERRICVAGKVVDSIFNTDWV
jgi:hypothetical protein